MSELFLSYAREDAAAAERLARSLERAGHDVWWDRELRGGASFSAEIERQLEDCSVVIVLWSKAAVQSSWVRDEAAIGRDAGKLLPISIDGTSPPIGFRQLHALNLVHGRGPARAAELRKIEQSVAELLVQRPQRIREPTRRTAARQNLSSRLLKPLMLAAAGLCIVAAAFFVVWRYPSGNQRRVAIVAASSTGIAHEFASDMSADMAPIVAARAKDASVADQADLAKSDYKLAVSVSPHGQGADATLSLTSRKASGIIWSNRWTVPDLHVVDLKQQMSLLGAQAILCALDGDRGGLLKDPGTLATYVTSCMAFDNSDIGSDELIGVLSKVVDRAPNFGSAWGMIAVLRAEAISDALNSRETVSAADWTSARSAIARSIQIDPHSGKALMALAELKRDTVAALPILDRAVAVEPQTVQIRIARSYALRAVGRNDAATKESANAVDLDPLSPLTRAAYIRALAYDGHLQSALEELQKAQKIWPNTKPIIEAAFGYHYRYGDPKVAENLLLAALGTDYPDAALLPYRKIIAARIEPTPIRIDDALASLGARSSDAVASNKYLIAAAQFGRTDEVYRLLDDPVFQIGVSNELLFRPEFAAVRADPRFMGVAMRLGLLRYWETSGDWPDFCTTETLHYDCKSEAARLHARGAVAQAKPRH